MGDAWRDLAAKRKALAHIQKIEAERRAFAGAAYRSRPRPRLRLAQTQAEIVADYVHGRIDVFEFEDRLDRLLGLG